MEGWEINSIITLQSPQHWGPMDEGTDAAGSRSAARQPSREQPDPMEFLWEPERLQVGAERDSAIRGRPQSAIAACAAAKALSLDGGTPGAATAALNLFGCYAQGSSVMIPPALGSFGNMGRNIFPDSGFRNVDFSLAKNWHFGERFRAQFRAEFFNIFNHPNFANPYGGQNGFGLNDPSAGSFGCGCATPDVAAANPVIGSGGSRAVQLGLKLIF